MPKNDPRQLLCCASFVLMMNVHGLRRNVKNVVRNYSDAQVKVREATSNDPWGPPSTLMGEIADLSYNVVAFTEIMQMIWKRLNDHGKNWRHVYKALVLLEYLIKTGSEKVSTCAWLCAVAVEFTLLSPLGCGFDSQLYWSHSSKYGLQEPSCTEIRMHASVTRCG